MIKFSIVIPCYNNFNMMERCLKSLQNQTFKNFEVIFIDDKSKDDLLEKLYEFQKKSKLNITILENEKNLGPGISRNRGIDVAQGQYITFIDADDYISEETLEKINEIIENERIDCIIYDYCLETKNHKYINQKSYLKNEQGFINGEDAMVYSTGSTWCKVYLLELLKKNNVKFPDLIRAEDMVFNKTAISYCEKIYYLNKSLYYYFINENSIMNNKDTLSIENLSNAIEILEKRIGKKFEKQLESIFIKEYFYGIMLVLIKLNKSKKEIIKHIEDCEKKYPNLYKNLVIQNMSKFQKICLKLAKIRNIVLLKQIVKLKELIKNNI